MKSAETPLSFFTVLFFKFLFLCCFFFPINHNPLFWLLRKRIKTKEVSKLFEKILRFSLLPPKWKRSRLARVEYLNQNNIFFREKSMLMAHFLLFLKNQTGLIPRVFTSILQILEETVDAKKKTTNVDVEMSIEAWSMLSAKWARAEKANERSHNHLMMRWIRVTPRKNKS